MHPQYIHGLEKTVLHTGHFILPEYGQQTPPSNLGAIPPVNRVFAETNADHAPHPGFNQVVGHFPAWRPLWNEGRMIVKHAELAWHYGTLAMNQIEDIVHTGRMSRSAQARANVYPTQQPTSQFYQIK